MIRRLLFLAGTVIVAASGQANRVTDVFNSSHNLSATGPGRVTSAERQACVFCHISHAAEQGEPYLWNQRSADRPVIPYQSQTMRAQPEDTMTGPSRRCLSCHDGTVAVGQTVASGRIPVTGGMSARARLGLDQRSGHPFGFKPADDGQIFSGLLRSPPVTKDSAVHLPNGRLECVSCHDPHVENRDSSRGMFLVRSNEDSALCLACHDVSLPPPNELYGWLESAHQSATNSRAEYYGTVGANACLSCHQPHNATAGMLLKETEEETCALCHGGAGTSPALLPVMDQFTLPFSHPVTAASGLHGAGEDAFPLSTNRHAECPDCHNSHAAQQGLSSAVAPSPAGALVGASGVDGLSGESARRPAANEYEICFKCHANSTDKPQSGFGYTRYGRTPWRVTDQAAANPFNTRLEFNSFVSRHNVTFPRQRNNAEVPSLRSSMLRLDGSSGESLEPGTYLYCGDCHNNDQARNSGGGQASGVHGSVWPHILERGNSLEPPPISPGESSPGIFYQPGFQGTYSLCDKCHDLNGSVLQDQSFPYHRLHVVEETAACGTCHDPHGINGGNFANNSALINFDTMVVGPSASGVLRYERLGSLQGQCYLTCHGENHDPESY